MMEDPFAYNEEDKKRAMAMIDKISDVIDTEEDHINIAALGSAVTFIIVNRAGDHNNALEIVKRFTEQLVNSIDDAFTK
jgi:hypothetical protein